MSHRRPRLTIRHSFRERASVHPDRTRTTIWAPSIERLNDAYDILSDTTLRAEYDEKRRRYRGQRGPDGIAWWERPHPKSSPTSSPESARPEHAPFPPSASPKRQRQRQPVYEYIYGRKRTYLPYQLLLAISSLVLFVSLCATLINPVRIVVPGATDGGTLAAGPQPAQPAQSAESTAASPRLCSDPDARITEPQDDDSHRHFMSRRSG
jgi:hypothetical protein